MPPTNNQFCSNVQADGTLSCGGGDYCPSGYSCITAVLTSNQDGHLYQACQCWPNNKPFPTKGGWRPKYEVAGLVGDTQDLPRRETAALTTPITPVFLREFLGRLPPPPSVELSVPIRTPASKRGTDYNLGKPTVSTGLNNYYGNTNGMTLYLRWRLGLGNAYQSWWPYDASDFPEDWWLPNVTDSWNNLFDECGAAPPKGQGLCCEAQAICAAQKHHWIWHAVQRAAERNMERARQFM